MCDKIIVFAANARVILKRRKNLRNVRVQCFYVLAVKIVLGCLIDCRVNWSNGS